MPMTAGERPAYSLVQADPRHDLAAIQSVWRGNFGPDADHPRKIQHLYLDGPSGPALVLILRDDHTGEAAGVIGAIPRPMRYAGTSITAAVISHVAVAPRHRTLGPVMKLHAEIFAASSHRFDLIYGHPNPRNAVVLKRARYQELGQIKRYVKVLKFGQYAGRVLPAPLARLAAPLVDALAVGGQWRRRSDVRGLDTRWSSEPFPQIDQVWQQSDGGRRLEAVRTTELLRWRFHPCIVGQVRYLLVSSAQGPLGWFACEDSTAIAGRLTLLDYRLIDMPQRHKANAIQALLAQAHAAGYNTVEIPLSGHAYGDEGWQDVGFVERGSGPITGAGFTPKLAGLDAGRIHMTYLDNDS